MAKKSTLPRPNVFHSPASTLPPDILSLIFQHACTIPDLNGRYGLPGLPFRSVPRREKRTQFILSAICVYWRQVSLSLTPYIWTTVNLVVSPRTVKKASAILQAFLAYSGQLPFALGIQFAGWEYGTRILVDTSSDEALYQNTHRIRELYLDGLPDAWVDLLPSLSNLVHLSIHHHFAQRARPVMIKSQCSNLTLKSFQGRIQLSYSEITVLNLFEAPVSFGLEMLVACPNLIEFRIRDAYVDEEEEIILPRDSFVLPRMETFEWPMYTKFLTDAALLQHIRLPALRKLVWVETGWDNMDPCDVFFHNLPSTLFDLHIDGATLASHPSAPTSIFDYVRDSFNIECLTLSYIRDNFLDHIFERLTPAWEISGSHQRVKLPKLKAMCIKGDGDFTPAELNQDKLLRMLKRRFLALGTLNPEPFRLELPSEVAWSPHCEKELKEMIGHGLKVEIFEGAKQVNWL